MPNKSKKTQFYSLSAVATPALMQGHQHLSQLNIGFGPVRLPRLLKRPQIMVRKSQFELDMAEFHQWAGTIQENLTAVLMENIIQLTGSPRVERYPWRRSFKADKQIRIEIERFDGQLGGVVILKARWRLLNTLGVQQKIFLSIIRAKTNNHSFHAYVEAQSYALAKLATEIVSQL